MTEQASETRSDPNWDKDVAIPAQSVPRSEPALDPLFDEFWSAYPRKVGKVAARHMWIKVGRRGAEPRQVVAAVERFRDHCRAEHTDQKFIPHPATWLRDGRYGDTDADGMPGSPAPAAPAVPAGTPRLPGGLNEEQILAAVIRLASDQQRPVTAARAIIAFMGEQSPAAIPVEFAAITYERARELAAMNYPDYLLTPEWRARRKIMLGYAEGRCQVCNSADKLHVHHRNYIRRGNEHPADLVVLCEGCHDLFHANGRLVLSP